MRIILCTGTGATRTAVRVIMNDIFCIGATVRLARPGLSKSTGTATIATLQENETACVLWNPLGPKPMHPAANSKSKRRLKRQFLVTPVIKAGDSEEVETTTDVSSLRPPLEFESTEGYLEEASDVPKWKDRGDQLLKLGDASKACEYYEMALRLSSILQVGATAVVKTGGRAKLADIDCLEEDDDDAIEVSMQDSGEEKVIKEAEVLLCLLDNGEEDHLQERILLNLARCLLQLGDLAKHQDMASERRPKYQKSAVLATTLALTIAEHCNKNNNDNLLTKYARTALLLRGQAQAGLGKFQNAIADTKRVIQIEPQHKEATKQLKILQGQHQRLKHVDRKLVKSMCKWVQTATNEDAVSESRESISTDETKGGHVVVDSRATVSITKPTNKFSPPPRSETSSTAAQMILVYVVLPLLVAYFLHQQYFG